MMMMMMMMMKGLEVSPLDPRHRPQAPRRQFFSPQDDCIPFARVAPSCTTETRSGADIPEALFHLRFTKIYACSCPHHAASWQQAAETGSWGHRDAVALRILWNGQLGGQHTLQELQQNAVFCTTTTRHGILSPVRDCCHASTGRRNSSYGTPTIPTRPIFRPVWLR